MNQSQSDQYNWPCDRHEAHGAHDDCPGVKAHPLTMIGRNELKPPVPEFDPDMSIVTEELHAYPMF